VGATSAPCPIAPGAGGGELVPFEARHPWGSVTHCVAQPPIRFISDSLTDSVPLLLRRQCDRTLGADRRADAGAGDGVALGLVHGGAQDRASPKFMGLASLGLDIGIFCNFLYIIILLSVIFKKG
jgi:hypothetical protein